MNLYHLFYTHNIKEALIDTKCKKHVDGVFSTIGNLQADFTTDSIDIDYLRGKDISMDVIHEFLLNSPLKSKYDLLVVHSDNVKKFMPFMHRCLFIYVFGTKNPSLSLVPYTKVNDCFEGVVFLNDFHSIIFPTAKLDVYAQTYVRDKPYRFLRKMQQLLQQFSCKTIVEIGCC